MKLTRGAIGNLISRYRAVLKKCHLLNVFGTLALASALAMGGAAGAQADPPKISLGGGTVSYTSADAVDNLMGGWYINGGIPVQASSGETPTQDDLLANGDVNLTVSGTATISEIIGGTYLRSYYGTDTTYSTAKHGSITTVISKDAGSTTQYVVGGSKISNVSYSSLETGDVSLTINSGTFGTEGEAGTYEAVIAGNYLKSDGQVYKGQANHRQEKDNIAVTANSVTTTIKGGAFYATVIGGSVVHSYSSVTYNDGTSLTATDNTSSINIEGGTFEASEGGTEGNGGFYLKAAVIGAGMAYGYETTATTGSSSVEITGGTFGSEDGDADAKVVAGAYSKGGELVSVGTSSLDVSGGTFYDDLVGGNFVNTTYDGDNTVGTSSVSVSGSAVVNATVVGGSEVNAGKSNVTSSSVSISGGTINGTAVGASAVESQGSTAASSKVTSSSVSISGGSVSRVIGGGLASTGSEATDGASASVSVGTSEVVISGGTVGSEDGVLSVAGGSLASGEGNKAETTGSASTIISGGTVIGPVAAGSAAAEGATASAGAVSLTVSGGTIEGSVYTGGASIDGSSVTTESSVLAVTGGTITEDLVVGDYVVSSAGVEGEEQAMLNAEGDSSSVSVSIANTTIGGTVSVVTDGAEVTFNGGTTTIGNLALNADSTTSVTNGATVSANDVNVEAGTLSIANGTLSVLDEIHAQSSTNEETGAIESSGTIQIGSGGTLSSAGKVVVDGNGALTVSEGGTLTLTETGTMEITGGKVTFADGSTLTVDATAAAAAATAIISVNGGELEVDAGSTLVLADAVSGQTYNIVDGSEEYWTNIVASSDMISMVMDKTTGTVSAAVADATSAYSGISGETGGLLQTLYSTGLNSTTADAAGVRFLSRATDSRYLGSDKGAAVKAIESTARFATLGAVPQMTKMASDAGTNAAVARFGFATSEDSVMAINAAGDEVKANDAGFALWIAPMWQNRSGFGMEAGELDYGFNGNIGGVAIGADYTFSNNIRAGLLFNMGGGYAESSGDLSGVENSMTFWGLGAYAGWTGCGFGIMADVMYTSTWNSVEGSLDSRLGMGSQLEADIQASAITAGLRAEYTFETSVLDFIPHVGVRYMSLNTYGYDVESSAGTILESDGAQQSIWTFPVGITFERSFELENRWHFRPSLDFTVIPAAGDVKTREDVRYTGLAATADPETQMMDYFTWQGTAGVEFGTDSLHLGVNYTLQAGQHSTGHGVFGTLRYEF